MEQPQPQPPRRGPLPNMEKRPTGSHGGMSGVRPPLAMAGTPAKVRRRTFLAPAPHPTAKPSNSVLPPRQEVPQSGLPPRQEVPQSSLPPRQEVPQSSLRPRQEVPGSILPCHRAPRQDPLAVTFTEPSSPPLGTTTHWDTRSTSSSPAVMGYDDADTSQQQLFDWTPDYYGNDQRGSSSQYYTNLLTEGVDGGLELPMQPSSGGKGTSKRGSNYSQEEDIQLCNSYISIGNDSIIGTDQSGKKFWERITAHYHAFRDFPSDRNSNSLEHRCGVIVKDCMRFQGYYEEVERRHPSGVPYQEHLLEAQARYAQKSKGKSFPFIHCWLILRHSEKFARVDKRLSKSKELHVSVPSQEDDVNQSPGKKARPPGRKQSKEKQKKGEGGEDYKDMMGNLMVMKAEEVELKRERWEKDLLIEQRKLDIKDRCEKRKLDIEDRRVQCEQQRLQWEQEQKIMFCDTSNMDEHQKAYILAKRAQFAKLASSSVETASVGDASSSQ